MKVLITGSSGMLGSSLIRTFASDKRYSLFGMGRSRTSLLAERDQIQIDFSQPSSISDISFEADIVIHTAAITDLSFCEANGDYAKRVHVDATMEVAKKTKKSGKFFYISTDSVFDGEKGNYSEMDDPNPLNVYAKTKLEGEKACGDILENTSILRTNLYGFHIPLKNSLTEWAFIEWSKGKKISGFTDVIFNALYTDQLSEIIKLMVDNNIQLPIINVASENKISKYCFLDILRKKLEMNESLLNPAMSNQFSSKIARPLKTSLDVSLLKTFTNAPSIEEGLSRCAIDITAQSVALKTT